MFFRAYSGTGIAGMIRIILPFRAELITNMSKPVNSVTMKVLQPLWNQSSPKTNICLAYFNYSYSEIDPKERALSDMLSVPFANKMNSWLLFVLSPVCWPHLRSSFKTNSGSQSYIYILKIQHNLKINFNDPVDPSIFVAPRQQIIMWPKLN